MTTPAENPASSPSEASAGTPATDEQKALIAQAKRVEELEDAQHIWPAWAVEMRGILREFGCETDDEDGCDLPEVFREWMQGYEAEFAVERSRLIARAEAAEARVEELAEIVEAARLLIAEGLRLTPAGLIVREMADKSDPHYRLCKALEAAGLIPSKARSALSSRGEGEQGASCTDRSSAGTLADPVGRLSNDRGEP